MSDATDRFLATFDDPDGVDVHRYPAGTRTAADAAAAIGCDVAQIVKSLVFAADGEPVLVLTSGANRVDVERVADLLGATRVTKADADLVRSATGFAIGGTPPFGHPATLPTLVDRDLLAHEVVWAAAGTPDSVFPLSPDVVVRRSGGRVADVSTSASG